ncbi:hypothetical protein HL657_07950 [Methanoculleus sp. YWC-01]|uniref:Glycosyltransferase RgtA/B/C/D-like domain-containing protein n=1 Tax=Methanoculleus nereidis TaxID=2735141 RepID=A0ABU3Z2R8_9EURY|nr:hypothetical protein [Methanoculleus sp. YWC-01]MDV4343099.1 hypothetical protein [Methanoculleus sp. YWC-01]
MQRPAIQEYFFENLDTIAGIAGIVFGIAITSLYLISATIHLLMLGPALTLASLLYLVIKNREAVLSESVTKPAKILLEIIFFILFAASLLTLHVSEGRPLLYFVLIALSAGFLALSIVFLKGKGDAVIQIVKILVISFNLKYSLFLGYYGVGSDYWRHLANNNLLSQYGFIEVLSAKEPYYPLMHIQVAITDIITHTPIKDATNFAIIIPLVISSICIFLVARNILNAKVGLLAMLIVNITDFHTYWGAAPQTTTYGICLYYFLIFFIFRGATTKSSKKTWLTFTLFFIPVLILAHAVSSFIALISVLGLIAGSCVYRIFYDNRAVILPPILVLLIYGVVLLQHWFVALYNQAREESFFDVIISTLITYVTEHADFLNRPEAVSGYVAMLPPLVERMADTTGLALLMFLSAIGCLFWLSKKYGSAFTFPMIVGTVMLLFITFGFPLFGIRNIIPSRWFAFMYFFLSIMAAFALLTILPKTSKKGLSLMMCFVILSSLTFFMTTSTISNEDSCFWLQETTISMAYTTQEGIGAETLSNVAERVLVDSRYAEVIDNMPHNAERISFSSDQQLTRTPGTVFLWRQYMLDRPVRTSMHLADYYKNIEKPNVLGVEILNKLGQFNKMYDNHGVEGYYLT